MIVNKGCYTNLNLVLSCQVHEIVHSHLRIKLKAMGFYVRFAFLKFFWNLLVGKVLIVQVQIFGAPYWLCQGIISIGYGVRALLLACPWLNKIIYLKHWKGRRWNIFHLAPPVEIALRNSVFPVSFNNSH